VEATAPVTVEQAAAILGVSPSTVHRRIRSGVLKAEQAQRPQGTVWLVHLPADTVTATAHLSPPTNPEATAPTGTSGPTTQAEALTGLVQATVATVLGPLVAELAASRQQNERQAERLEAQAEVIGSLRTENETLRAAQAPVVSQPAPDPMSAPVDSPTQRLRRLWPLVLVVAGIIVLALLLTWPR
jgi:hypothetical protein